MKTVTAALTFVVAIASSIHVAAQVSAATSTTTPGANQPAAQTVTVVPVPPTPAADRFWPDVTLNAVVIGKHGAPQKIDEQGFQLFEDGSQRPLRFPASADSPMSVALLVDLSSSIYLQQPDILSAVHTIVHALPADSEVTVIDFSRGLSFLDLPFTPVSKADLSILDKLQPSGYTALWDAVIATEDYFAAEAKYPRRAMVILSDGLDNASHVAPRTAFLKMQQPGAPLVYSCFVAKINFLPSRFGLLNLKRIAKEGGGLAFEFNTDLRVVPDPAAAAAVAAQIAAAINSQYVLQFTAADTTRDGKAHKLTLQLPDKGVHIHALPAYFAPAK